VDRRHADDIIAALTKDYGKCDRYQRVNGDKDDIVHVLEFTIDEKRASRFFDNHLTLGIHRGELIFYRPLPIPERVVA
jgi:hypothetical protein